MNLRIHSLVWLVLGLWPFPAPAADGYADKIARHIHQLGSDSFAEREAAGKALGQIGEEALPRLRDAAGSADPEVRRRAIELVAQICRRRADRARAPFLTLVTALGGRVTLDWEGADQVAASVDLAGTPVTDADMKRLAQWDEMRELDLSDTQITDNTLAVLRGTAGLRQLKLGDGRHWDLQYLPEPTLLEDLELGPQTRVTDEALADLRKSLPKLVVTTLGGCRPVLIGD
jgi:hypothetical protein